MSNLIHLLSDTLANQIAAGEVVQRPASVVKELMENAVDAASSEVKLIIKDAGKTLIQVIDDGLGMSETDARMSFERHATSKIKTADDLFNIHTMGFRGEALASIAAVAQVEMETCTAGSELGTRITIEGATVKSQMPVSAKKGTKISVKNLFFNVPARRNFLKSNPVESKHIIDEFQRVALARPDIAFSLYQNNSETYQLPPAKLSHRIVHLLGKACQAQLVPCQEETDLLKIKGYIGKPTYAKKTRGEQFFFVNQRFIKSNYMHHAVKSAFEGLLPEEAFPFYVLFIDIAPSHVDVNVHPTKTEIKFDEERVVYSMLEATVKQALAAHQLTPSIDFDQNANFNPLDFKEQSLRKQQGGTTEKDYTQFRSPAIQQSKDWERLFEGLGASEKEQERPLLDTEQPTTLTLPSIANQPPSSQEESISEAPTTPKVQLHKKYILTQVKSGILLIDQQAAHERIFYEKYLQSLENKSGASQQLLFPYTIELNPADFNLIKDCEKEICALGFVFESFGKNTIVVSGYPAEIVGTEPQGLLEGLIEQFKWNKEQLSLATNENLARSLAKRSCIRHGQKLSSTEMDAVVDQLFACTNANYAPDGRKVFVVLTLERLGEIFKG